MSELMPEKNMTDGITKTVSVDPLVSVIVPVYKVEDMLDRCISTIVRQTYHNLEIILVDDGSPDNCPSLCDMWSAKDKRIKVIHQRNAGLSAARNAAIDVCRGQYIAFVDSDDYVERCFVERMVHAAAQTGADMTICGIVRESIDQHGNNMQAHEEPVGQPEVLTRDDIIERFTLSSPNNLYVVAWNKLYSRSLWNDLRYPTGKINEDLFVIHRLYDHCRSVVVLPEAMYHYCLSAGSIMRSAFSIRRLDCVDAFCDRLTYLHGKTSSQVLNDTVMRALSELIQGYRDLDFTQPTVKSAYRDLTNRLESACRVSEDSLSFGVRCQLWAFMHARGAYSLLRRIIGFAKKIQQS